MIDFLLNRLRPSTRAFWRAARQRPDAGLWEALHGLVYLKWPEFYIRTCLGRSPAAKILRRPAAWFCRLFGLWKDDTWKAFADTYHGKVMPAPDIARLIKVDRPLAIEVPEKVLPYALARDIILNNPAELALLDCPCRKTVKNPCLPLDVCIIVGRKIVDFVLEHHPAKSRRITADEAVAVVEASHRRGHVSHAFFKEAVLGRYYAICNCCSCCCGAMQAYKNGVPMLASSGFIAALEAENCLGCGLCARTCPFDAIEHAVLKQKAEAKANGKTQESKADTPHPQTERNAKRSALLPEPGAGASTASVKAGKPLPLISTDACLGCGLCVLHCPAKALRLERDPSKPAPLMAAVEKDRPR